MTEDDNQFAGKLANAMSDLYDDKAQRIQVVDKVFKEVHLNFNILGKLPPYVIAEFKNEAAVSASEPYMQALAYYLESTKTYAPRMSGFALPCFLLVVFGPYVVFAGAVWNLRPVVQVLSTPLVFHYHSTDTQNQLTIARHMAAFCKAVRTLKEHYEHLSSSLSVDGDGLANTSSHDLLFPYPTEFKSLDDESTNNIRYAEQLEEDGKKTRLIFFGTLQEDPSVQICIKFTRRYSKEAHLHCAKLGFAPKLRGFEVLPGGWYMVVMDKLVGYDLLADLPDSDRLSGLVFETIREQLKTLHACQLVHGDVRDTNVLVKKDDRAKFMIIDFDWAGKIGDVRYPPYVNYMDVWRPEGARDGKLVEVAHDDEMLDAIDAGNRGE
ncbi:hypothetical protein BU15DRAFT_90679 [Melanogaster broomeanus]|nr:hypothetical protein BU15DRAFT_90679 [Melanogaster broomeanus]